MVVDESDTPLDAWKGGGEGILAVDDDPTQRKIDASMRLVLGYRVEPVNCVEAAVDDIQSQEVALMLLDRIMPRGINGRETYSSVGRIRPGQRAITASGFSNTGDVSEAQWMGAGGLLKQPYAIETSGQAVRSAHALSPRTG